MAIRPDPTHQVSQAIQAGRTAVAAALNDARRHAAVSLADRGLKRGDELKRLPHAHGDYFDRELHFIA
jgi:hypothetical protein